MGGMTCKKCYAYKGQPGGCICDQRDAEWEADMRAQEQRLAAEEAYMSQFDAPLPDDAALDREYEYMKARAEERGRQILDAELARRWDGER